MSQVSVSEHCEGIIVDTDFSNSAELQVSNCVIGILIHTHIVLLLVLLLLCEVFYAVFH